MRSVEQNVLAVGGLTEGEQPRPGRQEPQDGGSVDGLGDVFESSGHAINGIVELSVETYPALRLAGDGRTLKPGETRLRAGRDSGIIATMPSHARMMRPVTGPAGVH